MSNLCKKITVIPVYNSSLKEKNTCVLWKCKIAFSYKGIQVSMQLLSPGLQSLQILVDMQKGIMNVNIAMWFFHFQRADMLRYALKSLLGFSSVFKEMIFSYKSLAWRFRFVWINGHPAILRLMSLFKNLLCLKPLGLKTSAENFGKIWEVFTFPLLAKSNFPLSKIRKITIYFLKSLF